MFCYESYEELTSGGAESLSTAPTVSPDQAGESGLGSVHMPSAANAAGRGKKKGSSSGTNATSCNALSSSASMTEETADEMQNKARSEALHAVLAIVPRERLTVVLEDACEYLLGSLDDVYRDATCDGFLRNNVEEKGSIRSSCSENMRLVRVAKAAISSAIQIVNYYIDERKMIMVCIL